jgi:hypothetical protein
MAKRTTRSRRSAKKNPSTTQLQQEPTKINTLGLIISAVALSILVLFFVPWVQGAEGGENLSGLDVASRTVAITDDFPGGVVFILPLVVGSILFQYYRRLKQSVRPRRRLSTLAMLIIGLIATGLWIRSYTINATELLNEQETIETVAPEIFTENQGNEPTEDTDTQTTTLREPVTTGDVLQEQFELELWLHLALSASLLILPFLDDRPEAESPQI